jgi:pimeloyl-ACP methyl ester carboxylesterase
VSEDFYENAELVAFVKQLLRANEHPQAPEGFERQADASSRHDLRGRLGGLAMPVHVISGAHDVLVPRWKQEELAAGIPGARLTVIDGGPHALQLEKAQEFSAAVLDFIADAAVSA